MSNSCKYETNFKFSIRQTCILNFKIIISNRINYFVNFPSIIDFISLEIKIYSKQRIVLNQLKALLFFIFKDMLTEITIFQTNIFFN